MTIRRILCIDNDPKGLKYLTKLLQMALQNAQIYTATNPEEARHKLNERSFHLIIVDLRLTDNNNKLDDTGLKLANAYAPIVPKIIFTSFTKINSPEKFHNSIQAILKKEHTEKLIELITKILADIPESIDEFTGHGTLTANQANYYVPRNTEEKLIRLIKQKRPALIIEPSQQGKTSLMNFIVRCTQLKNDIIFSQIDMSMLDPTSEASWYKKLVEEEIASNWHRKDIVDFTAYETPTDHLSWVSFLRRVTHEFQQKGKVWVILFDEMQENMPKPGNFFGALRSIYNQRQQNQMYQWFTFVLASTIHPKNLLLKHGITKFSMDFVQKLELPDFSEQDIEYLTAKVSSDESTIRKLATDVYTWTKGHPYLTHRLCNLLCQEGFNHVETAVKLLREQETKSGFFELLTYSLLEDRKSREFLISIMKGNDFIYSPLDPLQKPLQNLGLIINKNGYCAIRNQLYADILEEIYPF